jgi:hypothetical protein
MTASLKVHNSPSKVLEKLESLEVHDNPSKVFENDRNY